MGCVHGVFFILSCAVFVLLLGNILAILMGPVIGVSGAMLGYGLIEKVKVHKYVTDWLDKDG